MVPNNILQRTFHIAHKGGGGTIFTVDIEGRQYILTAKHVVEGLLANSTITISHENGWQDVSIGEVWFSPTGADVAVISPKAPISFRDVIIPFGYMILLLRYSPISFRDVIIPFGYIILLLRYSPISLRDIRISLRDIRISFAGLSASPFTLPLFLTLKPPHGCGNYPAVCSV